MGTQLKKTTQKPTSLWSAKFMAQSEQGTRLPPVYFGYAKGTAKSMYPLAPSFSSLNCAVFDRNTATRYGHHIGEDTKDGLVKELHIDNTSDTAQTIHYHFEQVGAFPETYSAWCLDAESKALNTGGTITVPPQSSVSRWVIASDAAFKDRFISSVIPMQFSFHALFPNPFRTAVNIRYTVPFGANERIQIAIYTLQGRLVWEKRIDGLLSHGMHRVRWNGCDTRQNPVGSGLYLVRLMVIDERGKTTKQFLKQATLLR